MEFGQYYEANQKRTASLVEADWRVALGKCKEHIRWKLKQRTLSGAHSAAVLGGDPVGHYLGLSYEKILTGEWEWKAEFSLTEQMIRIINSHISTEVEKAKSEKGKSFKTVYPDLDEEFYDRAENPASEEEAAEYEKQLQSLEKAVAGDGQLEFLVEALREGKKRAEIAELLEILPTQLDKLREKLIRKVRSYHATA